MKVQELDTPAVVVDLAGPKANIERAQKYLEQSANVVEIESYPNKQANRKHLVDWVGLSTELDKNPLRQHDQFEIICIFD